MVAMLTPKEAAAEYRLGVNRVRRLIAEGTLPALRVQQRILIPRSGLEAYIERALAGESNDPGITPTHDPSSIVIR